MPVLVKTLGIAVVILGVVLLLSPQILNQIITFFRQGKRVYFAGGARILAGIILLLSAGKCELPIIVVLIGILLVAAGIFVFLMGAEKCISVITKMESKPPAAIRLLMAVPIIIGILLIYSA